MARRHIDISTPSSSSPPSPLSGVLVQLPLPAHIDEEAVLAEVALEKDVDGFHPINIGQLAMKGRHPLFAPCTPEVSGTH